MAQVKTTLVGGTDGEPEGFGGHPFFHKGIKAIQLNTKLVKDNDIGCRILPAFDYNLDPASEEFKVSVMPYRDQNKANSDGSFRFSQFYFTVKGYNFLGNGKKQFTSPLSGSLRDDRGVDPLFDMYFTAKTHPDWKYLIEKPTFGKGEYQILPLPRKFAIMNAVVKMPKTGDLEVRLIVVGSMCMDMIKESLDRLCPKNVPTSVDPNWPDYLFGDVTSPEYGSWADVKVTEFNTAGMKDAGFQFSKKQDTLIGHVPWPLSEPWGTDYLRERQNIADLDNVTKITSAEEILDYVVQDDFLPYELIEKACAGRWEIPAQSTNPTFFHGRAATPEDEDDGSGLGPVRQPAAAPAARPAPAPRAAAPAAPRPPAPGAAPRPSAPGAARPATPAAAPAARPAAPAARPAAPTAAPRPGPAAPAAPRPAAPVAGAPRPQASGARPPGAAATPAHAPRPAARVSAPPTPVQEAPAPEPVAETAPVEAPAQQPATPEEVAEFADLSTRFAQNPTSLSTDEMNRYAMLSDVPGIGG